MQICGIQYLTKTKAKVSFENGIDCMMYLSEIRKAGIEDEKEITEEQYKTIMEEILLKRAKKKAMNLLIRCDRTEKELRDKLKQEGFPNGIIDEAIRYVDSYHYINEQNYLENYIKFNSKGKSRAMLVRELEQKGLEQEQIVECLEKMYDEKKELRFLIEKRLKGKKEFSLKEEEKMARYLFQKGFKASDIYGELKTLVENNLNRG